MATGKKDKIHRLPKRFRASADPNDAAAFEILQANDAEQRERLGEAINAPYLLNTPLQRARAKAYITIHSIEQAANYTDEVIEYLAENYATVGRYDVARDLTASMEKQQLYIKYWNAVWLDDHQWCDHARKQKYIKEYIWSVRDKKERPMLACNVCDIWNVADPDYPLQLQMETAAKIREATKGMSMGEKLEYLKANMRPA